jgi:hypothetical protein
MKLDSVGTVVATREIDIDGTGKVLVTIGMPQEFPEGGSFFCPYQISGMGDGKVRYSGGADGVQALELTLQRIGTDLYTSDEFKADRLRSEGRKNLGFPVPACISDLVPKD